MTATRKKRYFRYRVVDVGGSMIDRIKPGDLTFDYWHGNSHTYNIFNVRMGQSTGWHRVKSEGECSEEEYENLERAGKIGER